MPDDCARRIESSLKTKSATGSCRTILLRRALITAAIMACLSILTVSGVSNPHQVKNLLTDSIRLSTRNAYDLLFGLETQSQNERTSHEAMIQYWDLRLEDVHPTEWPLAQVRDGRLYFIACGENIDITDQCSLDEVFIYTYTDEWGFLHYIGIGGTPDGWGHFEVLLDTLDTYIPTGSWYGGGGAGCYWNNKTDEPYGWYAQFKELTGHPYPL